MSVMRRRGELNGGKKVEIGKSGEEERGEKRGTGNEKKVEGKKRGDMQ